MNTIKPRLLEINKPVIMSFHDYYLITPIWTMQDQEPAETTSSAYAIKFFGGELHFYGGNFNLPEANPNIHCHGVYSQGQLPQILENIDVGIIPSVFPETFSIVLSEMWQGKVATAVSDIGALGEDR